ncbi:biotin/lipoyl-containing protein [Lactobacillaceae bacterium 24-114]
MKFEDVQKLMHKFENSDIRELDISDGDFHLYLSKNKQVKTSEEASQENNDAKPESTPQTNGAVIKAPLVGTVYLQPKPDEAPYVSVGSKVHKGDVVCVIEAMKMMTEIKSDFSGTVTAVNVDNEELVEVEQPLFTIEEEAQ